MTRLVFDQEGGKLEMIETIIARELPMSSPHSLR